MPRERFSFFDGGGGGGGSSVADLIMSGGRAQADAELRRGAATADTINSAASALQGISQDYFKRRDDKKVAGAVRAAVMPGATRKTPGFDASGNPTEETTPGADVRGILDGLPPELQGRAMKGIQDWQDMIGKRAESDARLTKLQQEIEETKKTRQQHDFDTLAVGAHHVTQLFDTDSASAGLIGANGLYSAAKGAGLADDKMDTFMAGANEAWEAAKGDPKREAMFKEAFQAQAGPILESLKQRGSASVQEKFKPDAGVNLPEGGTLVDPRTGKVIAKGEPKPETRSLQIQRAEALANGDTATAASLLKQITEEAAATRDPNAGSFNLGPGDERRDRNGRVIATRPVEPKPKAVTGAERQTLAYYNRAQKAIDDITPIEGKVAKYGWSDQAKLAAPGMAGNLVQSDEQQSYRQAQRAFTEVRLRKESGAAIPDAEYANDSRTYFAQPGDSEATIKQKAEARAVVLEGLRYGSGKAYDEYYGEPAPKPGDRKAKPIPDASVTGKKFRFDPQTGQLVPL